MRHGIAKRKLGMESAHRMLTLRNLCTSLAQHGRITTTLAKAKEVRPMIEKLVTVAKKAKNDLNARRTLYSTFFKKEVAQKMIDEIAVRFANRNGGYTRVLKRGYRYGDSAPIAIIEFVDYMEVMGFSGQDDSPTEKVEAAKVVESKDKKEKKKEKEEA